MTSVSAGTRTVVRLAHEGDHEAIHRLNYRTFVEEIPQHAPNPERRLVDRFHHENLYVVQETGGVVVGMVSARTARPFSLDQKLGPIDDFLPAGCRPAEVRLLAVDPAHRSTRAAARLIGFIATHLRDMGYDTAVASCTTRQLPLYQHLGFTPFAALVGNEGAWYQPMYVDTAAAERWPAALRVTA